ncbi:hypothetical protein FO519_009462, partial [Halicephalobus sp. NKZ332]
MKFFFFGFFFLIKSSEAAESLLDSRKLHVPLGEHVKLDCEIMRKMETQGFEILETKWNYLGIGHKEDLGKVSYERIWVNNSEFSLTIYDVQDEDAGKYECLVWSQDDRINITNSSSINIVVQNCGSEKDRKQSVNPLDPCVYGSCRILTVERNDSGVIKKLSCECGEQ